MLYYVGSERNTMVLWRFIYQDAGAAYPIGIVPREARKMNSPTGFISEASIFVLSAHRKLQLAHGWGSARSAGRGARTARHESHSPHDNGIDKGLIRGDKNLARSGDLGLLAPGREPEKSFGQSFITGFKLVLHSIRKIDRNAK